MDQIWIALGALLVSGLSVLFVVLRGASFHGGVLQRVTSLEKRAEETENKVESVASAVAEVSVVKEKVMGLDRLVTSQLDEIKHTLRRLEERSFDPSTPAGRKRAAAP